MAVFTFVARDNEGNLRKGVLEAETIGEVSSKLRQRGWFIEDIHDRPVAVSVQPRGMNRWLRIRSLDVEIALKQLALMVKNRVSILAAMQVVSQQSIRPAMATTWRQMMQDVQGGSSLANAMKKKRCFNLLIQQLVEVGERTGKLDETLTRGVLLLEKRRILRGRFVQALTYPAIVLFLTFGAVLFMVFSVLPKIQIFLATLNKRLPPITQALLDIVHWFQIYWPFLAISGVTFLIVGVFFYFWPPGKAWIDQLALKIPIYGKILKLFHTALFARTLSTMVGSGLTILEGLRLESQLHSNQYLRYQVQIVRECVQNGTSLAQPLAQIQAYLPLLAPLVAVGETSGNLPECLEEVANFYENELESTIRWLGIITVPVVILVIGGIIGFVYIAFFMSILGGISSNLR